MIGTTRPFSLFVSVALIKTLKKNVNQQFFKLALDHYIMSIDVKQDVKGGMIKNLHLEDLRIVALRVPPLGEQQRIVTEVERLISVADNLEQVVRANLKRAERLRQAILKEAFAGRLLPQDSTDEPASALLERIKAERAAGKASAEPLRQQTSANGKKHSKQRGDMTASLFAPNPSAEPETATAGH